ncbi:MAG TPA: TIGR03435 family protein [Acidobacteriaceae bacterium]|nr:TIGR03435 family protein [Acidobacteriaceae bacterium]
MILSGRFTWRPGGGAGTGLAVCISLAATMAMAQAAASPAQAGRDNGAKLPDWDVVSIKQAEPNSCTGGAGSWLTQDGLVFHCDPLMFVVESAYQIMEPSRIIGAPEWLKNGGLWEIHAKVAGDDAAAFYKLSRHDRDLMVRSLLADRLHMKAHVEQREMPVYDLVVAKGGPRMKEAKPEENDKTKMASSRGGEIDAVAVTMDALPWMLGEVVGRPVVNKTGLPAKYDFTLRYLPGAQSAADETGRTSIFTALEEQLGLKLTPARDMAEVLVIDSIERPVGN